MLDQFLAIRVFSRVVETGSFTKAADSLEMPKSTVSKLISDLETHLQTKLLQRTTRKLTVTFDGKSYYESTSPLLRQLDEIQYHFGSVTGRPKGLLRVDIGSSLASNVLIPALPDFYALYPEISLELGVTDRPVNLIGENFDCVVRGGAIKEPNLVARKLGEAEWVTCAAPKYLEKYGNPTHPSELNQHHLVNYHSANSGRAIPPSFENHGQKMKPDCSGIFGVNESNAHVAAGLAGLGIIQSFDFIVEPYLKSSELLPVLVDWQPSPYPFYVVYPSNRHVSQRLRVFIDWLIDVFPKH